MLLDFVLIICSTSLIGTLTLHLISYIHDRVKYNCYIGTEGFYYTTDLNIITFIELIKFRSFIGYSENETIDKILDYYRILNVYHNKVVYCGRNKDFYYQKAFIGKGKEFSNYVVIMQAMSKRIPSENPKYVIVKFGYFGSLILEIYCKFYIFGKKKNKDKNKWRV